MKRYLARLKYHGLFLKMFIILVVSIIAVSVSVSWTTIRISERLFINTFSITNAKVIGQIKSGFESLNTAVVTAVNNIQQSGTVKQFLTEGGGSSLAMSKTYYNMNKQMNQIAYNVDAFEIDISISGANGRVFATKRENWPIADEALKREPMTAAAKAQPRRLLYQYSDGLENENGEREPIIAATKALMERSSGKIYGVMYLVMKESRFKRYYESYTSEGNHVVVLSKDGVIVSSDREELIGQRAPELLGHARDIEKRGLDYKDARFMDKDNIILADYLSFYDMHVVNLIDKQWALGQLIDTKSIALICIAIVGVALIIVFLIFRRLTRSLTRLVKQISNISKYDFHHYVAVSGSFETRQLAHAFNFMLDELHVYVDELVKTQKKQRNAELAALQRQINPHFLYNTLASIKIMVQQGSREKAAETINALIALLQNAIGNVSETVSIEQELDNLKSYVFINQVRYGERIKVNYFVAPDCMEAHVPKLIIQPFIENSFFHAFNAKQEGYIYVLIAREGGDLVCEIADNGDGMERGDGSKLPKASSSRQLFTGIGVSNVNDRLKLLYGEPYGITIASEPGQGTQVRIRLPFLREPEDNASFQQSS
ncbi:cache domain-containing sensor histidine kinase [Paenibacillus xanthanilyticus]|uniref:histidine kinase n=1 Tax=Paenibacillus xanthanilyticus TaxID=1783531 RepID=A0ABV8KDK4_9BACL